MLELTTLDLHHRLLELAESMRPLPSSVTRLASVIGSDTASVEDVVEVLREDPGLVAAILREANSAASAAKDAIATVEGAVVRLGFARVLAVSVSQSVRDELDTALPAYGVASGVLYHHAIGASHVAEVLRPMSSRPIGPEVVTAALLHDIGTILLTDVFDRPVLDAARASHDDLTAAERELADIDHAELSAMLIALWKLPAGVVEAVRWHHRPALGESDLAHAVAIADAIVHQLLAAETGWTEELDGHVLDESCALLGIDRPTLVERSITRLERVGLRPVGALRTHHILTEDAP